MLVAGAAPSTSSTENRNEPISLGDIFDRQKQQSQPSSDSISSTSCLDKATLEMEKYTLTATLEGNGNPLNWWKTNHFVFPLLSDLAKKYLSPCATSVSSERMFSIAGHIVNKKRSSLKPEKVDRLVFLATNQ